MYIYTYITHEVSYGFENFNILSNIIQNKTNTLVIQKINMPINFLKFKVKIVKSNYVENINASGQIVLSLQIKKYGKSLAVQVDKRFRCLLLFLIPFATRQQWQMTLSTNYKRF